MNFIEIPSGAKEGFLQECVAAVKNARRAKTETVRKYIIHYVADRKIRQAKSNKNWFRRMGILTKDAFPSDEMTSYFITLYMDIFDRCKISRSIGVPYFSDANEAPDWWNESDFELIDDISNIMTSDLLIEMNLLSLSLANKEGSIYVGPDLYSYVNKWSV